MDSCFITACLQVIFLATSESVFSENTSIVEIISTTAGTSWQGNEPINTANLTPWSTISGNSTDITTPLSTKHETDIIKNGTVQLGGINIDFCAIWTCKNRCFQKTNEVPVENNVQSEAGNITSYSNQTVHAKCSCDNNCVKLGDCCVDFFSLCLNITNEDDVIELVKHALYDSPSSSDAENQFEFNVTQMILNYGSCVVSPEGEKYTMIISCPLSADDVTTVTTCTEADKYPEQQPYSDVDDMALTFRNIHCARCHSYSEKRLVPWQHGIACQNADVLQDSSSLEDEDPSSADAHNSYLNTIMAAIESGECTYIYRPPEDTPTQPRHCLPSSAELDPDLNAGSDTDSPCTFEDMLLCKAYSYQTFSSDDEEVKNPHCLKCMTGSTPVKVDLPCARADNQSRDTEGSSTGQGGILALFSTDNSGSGSIVINGHAIPTSGIFCKDDQVFDYVFLVCRTLFCPLGYRPIHGKCTPVDHYVVPAKSQMIPSGTEKLHVTFDLKDNLTCENKLLEISVRQAFHDTYTDHSAAAIIFSCQSDNSSNQNDLSSLQSCHHTVYMTVHPVTNLSRVLNSLEGMLSALSFVHTFVVTNYDTEPKAECEVGLPELVHDANITEIDGKLFVERSVGPITVFYPLTNTVFKSHLSKFNTSEQIICSVYISLLCVQPQIISSLNCSSVAFDINRTLVKNGTLFITNTDLSFPESQYEFHDGFVLVCSDFENLNELQFFHFSDAQYYLSWACSLTSVVCLMTSLVAFALLPYLKTLAGHMTASLAGSLALGQLLILVDFIPYRLVCFILAAVCHFCWLAAFTWMTALAMHMTRTFFGSMATKTGRLNANEVRREYRKYSLGGWGIPLSLVVTLVILDAVDESPFEVGYGTPLCGWMRQSYAFLVPVAVALGLNVVCFLLTLTSIERAMRASRAALTHHQKNDRHRVVVYIKMMSAMGFTWVAGFLASFTDVTVFWWVYIVLNGLQGAFIAFSFVLNARLVRVLKAGWSTRNATTTGPRRGDTVHPACRISSVDKELAEKHAFVGVGGRGSGQGLSCVVGRASSGQSLFPIVTESSKRAVSETDRL